MITGLRLGVILGLLHSCRVPQHIISCDTRRSSAMRINVCTAQPSRQCHDVLCLIHASDLSMRTRARAYQ